MKLSSSCVLTYTYPPESKNGNPGQNIQGDRRGGYWQGITMSRRLRNFMIIWAAMLSTLAVQVHGAAPIFVGTGTGLYKSTDAGASWTMVNVPLPSLLKGQLNVFAVRKDPQNPSKMYLIGLAGGAWAFFATHDGGQTWTATPFVGMSPGSWSFYYALAVDFAGQVIYITASTAGSSALLLYKSTDVGATWTQVKIPATVAFSPAVNIVADPLVSGTIYVLTSNNEFVKSTDFGGSWTKLGGPGLTLTSGGLVPQTSTLNIKVDPRNPLIWYFGTDHNAFPATCPLTNGGLCGLFKSTDGGATFTGLNIPINYVSSVSFGVVSSTVYATGQVAGLGPTVMRSTDSGNTWTPLVDGLFTAQSGEVWADPTDASTIYVDDGVYSNVDFYASTDGGATFPQRATPVGPPTCVPGNCARQPINDLLFVPPSGPVIGAVVNGASFLPGIAPATWITIYGTGLSAT
ncbi:MAG: WD40/YVTN/BNR-like repeat-containing protein, partial [Candidatus Dormibacteraceae bacterium]